MKTIEVVDTKTGMLYAYMEPKRDRGQSHHTRITRALRELSGKTDIQIYLTKGATYRRLIVAR